MCDKCIDKKIAHFEDLAARLLDTQTVEAIKKLIEEMLAEKTLSRSGTVRPSAYSPSAL
jgi:hypothetical protein